MDIIDFLKEQHRRADQIFARFEKAKRPEEKQSIFDELARLLVGHDAMEREIFYPACEKTLGRLERLMEGVVEHGLVEFSLFRADRAREKDDFEYFVKVLREVWDNHVEEEETQVLPYVSRKMAPQQLEKLATAMEARFDEVESSDFWALLRHNLEQVLAGRAKKKVPARRAKAPAVKRPARPAAARAGAGRKRAARGKAAAGRAKRTTRRTQR